MGVSEYLGPGYWAVLHIDSYNANDYDSKVDSANTIARIITKFPCEKCRRHATEYASANPLIHSVKDSDPYSVFKWVWKFHNAVNSRLGKPIITIEEAIEKWGGSCTKEDCA